MVAGGHYVDPPVQQLVADFAGDPPSGSGVFGVRDDQIHLEMLNEVGKPLADELPAGAPDDIPKKQ
jgi:hypothetical protein